MTPTVGVGGGFRHRLETRVLGEILVRQEVGGAVHPLVLRGLVEVRGRVVPAIRLVVPRVRHVHRLVARGVGVGVVKSLAGVGKA